MNTTPSLFERQAATKMDGFETPNKGDLQPPKISLTIATTITLSSEALKALGWPSRVSLSFDPSTRIIKVGHAVEPQGYAIGCANTLCGVRDFRKMLLENASVCRMKVFGKDCCDHLEFNLDAALSVGSCRLPLACPV